MTGAAPSARAPGQRVLASLRQSYHALKSIGRHGRTNLGLIRFRRTLCRLSPMTEQATDQPDPATAIRWLGPVAIGGETHEALFCHPTSRVAYRLAAAPRGRLVARCALLPGAWPTNSGGVEFELTVTIDPTGERMRLRRRVDPRRRRGDRRWRSLKVALPRRNLDAVTVTLATRVPDSARPDYAWAVWGEPALELRRPLAELRQRSRFIVGQLRRHGLGAALRAIRDALAVFGDASAYLEWLARHAPTSADLEWMTAQAQHFSYRPLISIITPAHNTDPEWLRACVESVRRQAYTNWELCLCDDGSTRDETRAVLHNYGHDLRVRFKQLPSSRGISAASNAALSLATGEFVAFLDHDDELTPDALYEMVRFLNEHREADFVYSDEDKLDLAGRRCDAFFKPDWSPEHFLSLMYTCHLMLVRRSLVEQIGGFREGYEGAQDYDLVLRLLERTTRIHHVPKVLYHWRKVPQSTASAGSAKPWAHDAGRLALEDYIRRNRLDAEVVPAGVPNLYRVRHRLKQAPLVSVVVPLDPRWTAMDDLEALDHTVQTLAEKTAYRPIEVLIVTRTPPLPASTARLLERIPHCLVPLRPGDEISVSGQVNVAAARARGEQLLLVDRGLDAMDKGWLAALLEYSQQDEIGAVGGKLYYADGRLEHIGLLLGIAGTAAPALHQHPGPSYGYFSSAISTRNYSAVSRACLMTRRRIFEQVGGFDERLAVYDDVDYCLKVRDAGYRVVFTPYAQLRRAQTLPQNRAELEREAAVRLRERWGEKLDDDPYYNRNLSRASPDYRPAL